LRSCWSRRLSVTKWTKQEQIDEAIPGAEVKEEGIQLVLNENAVRFDTNKSSLTADAKANLEKLVPVFRIS
jgi:outer membrane protein OmpA-like peptidoglycan-associated protein